MWIGYTKYEGTFFKFSKSVRQHIPFDPLRNSLYVNHIYLDAVGIYHKREVYNYLDAFGDLGGVIEVLMLLFGMIVLPISNHDFYL